MNLSKRLEAVATLVDIGTNVIDVGCDHAFLDIYLTLNNNNKCIATDISQNALNIAIENIKKYNLSNKIETKLTNGLTGLNISASDTIVISGMGTYRVLEILKTNILSDTLIISSNNNIDILRYNVLKLGFYIDTEIFLIEKNKPYIIIKFKRGIKKYKKIDYILGPILKNNLEYQNYLIKKYNDILNKISKRKIFIRLKYKKMLFIIKRQKNSIKHMH